MKRHRKQPVDSQVLAFWRGRSVLLGRMLSEAPTGEQSWFWKIQSDIINYLLDRYGGNEPQSARAAPTEGTALLAAAAVNPPTIEVRPSSSFTADVGEGKLPRASGKIRPVLQEIAGGNYYRYEMLLRLQEEEKERVRIEYQRMLDALPRSAPGTWPTRLLIDPRPAPSSEAPLVPSPEMAGVTDDEIAGILSGEIVVEAILADILDKPDEEQDTRDAS